MWHETYTPWVNACNSPNTAAISCSITDTEIAPPANGRVSIDGLTYTYTCNPGYTLNGSMTRTCGDDGTWSSTAPTCESKLVIILIHSSVICQFLVPHVTFWNSASSIVIGPIFKQYIFSYNYSDNHTSSNYCYNIYRTSINCYNFDNFSIYY